MALLTDNIGKAFRTDRWDLLWFITEVVNTKSFSKISWFYFFHTFPDPLGIQRKFWFERNQFQVTVMNSALEKGEQYKVKMKFRAWLTADLAGLYKSTYKRKDGTEVTIAATQFQPTDARRTFPCFDEPALKATFTVTLAHDPKYISISNMPIKRTERENDWQLDHFEKTPVMPTYLLAFVVCDFANRTSTTKHGTNVSVW